MAEAGALRLRAATDADAALLLRLRNDDAARRASPDARAVGLDEHRRWLAAALADPLRRIRIAEVDGRAVGSARAEAPAPGAPWRLSWVVDAPARGRGHGTAMLRALLAEIDGPVCARIACDNRASETIARRAGLSPRPGTNSAGFRIWTCDVSAGAESS